MTIAKMHRCDFCEAVADEMNEGVVRLTDNVNEIRFDICEDCTEQHLSGLELKPRRGRAAQAEAAAA